MLKLKEIVYKDTSKFLIYKNTSLINSRYRYTIRCYSAFYSARRECKCSLTVETGRAVTSPAASQRGIDLSGGFTRIDRSLSARCLGRRPLSYCKKLSRYDLNQRIRASRGGVDDRSSTAVRETLIAPLVFPFPARPCQNYRHGDAAKRVANRKSIEDPRARARGAGGATCRRFRSIVRESALDGARRTVVVAAVRSSAFPPLSLALSLSPARFIARARARENTKNT